MARAQAMSPPSLRHSDGLKTCQSASAATGPWVPLQQAQQLHSEPPVCMERNAMQRSSARRLSRWALLVGVFLCPAAGRAQEALVLSGGGARGLAHVGVVMQLKALGYDTDIVVGT